MIEEAPDNARVPVEVRTEVDDPFEAYRRARYEEGGFYMTTNSGEDGWGYFGISPVRRLNSYLLPDHEETDSFGLLNREYGAVELYRGESEVPFPCGVAGWVSYDTLFEGLDVERSTLRNRRVPRLEMGVYDCLAAWEEPRGETVTLRISCCPRADGEDYGGLGPELTREELYDRSVDRAKTLAERALDGNPDVAPPPSTADEMVFESVTGKDDHQSQVRRIISLIEEGAADRLEASHHLAGPAGVHPVEVFDELREINPASHIALVEFPSVDLVSANMQLLMGSDDAGTVTTEYYGGTHPRGETEDVDARRRRSIETSEKYQGEHDRLTDLIVSDLETFCDPETIELVDEAAVEQYSEVFHLVSRGQGQLPADATPVDALRHLLPGPLAGDPKPTAFELVEEVQRTRRGPYCGCLGLLGYDGHARFGTNIRMLTRIENEYYLGLGGGIMPDSNPEWEFAETINKGKALINAIREASPAGTEVYVDEEYDQKPIER